MYSLFFIVFLFCGLCGSDEVDLGYSLRVGHAIDVFANYGDLCQVTQVVSADYDDEEEDEEPMEPFREKNIRVFANAGSEEDGADSVIDTTIELCETFHNLLNSYFKTFKIEGADKPWKAFMGDWILDEIMRTFGLEYDTTQDDCCYVLVRMVKAQKSVKLGDLKDTQVVSYVQRAIDGLNVSDPNEIRKFMKSYGTHYIDSYVTGNSIYQVFKYKRSGFNLLKSYVRKRNSQQLTTENLRFYFSSYFLKQIGDIRIASGNKTIERWAQKNLRDNQYLYSRPSLLRLYRNLKLVYKLDDLLDDGALLGMTLKTLRPLFKEKTKGEKYAEVLENDIKLWEINA